MIRPAATKDPTNQSALKREVMIGRSFGYASSPINDEPAMMQKGMPKPNNKRATTYIPAVRYQYDVPGSSLVNVPLTDSACISDAITMIHDPKKIDHLRPKRSLMYGTKGSAKTAPRLYAAEIIPRSAPFGWLKSANVNYHSSIVARSLQACHCGDI
jgi:hypothetical protein